MQIIGIILVVLGHSLHEYPDGQFGSTTLLYRLCYSFHMPLFLFVGGFLMVYTTEVLGRRPSASTFIVSKIRRLLLPMIVLTVITFVPRHGMSFAADNELMLNAHDFAMAFLDKQYMPIPFFWFIQVSFILLIVCFLLLWVFRKMHLPSLAGILIIFGLLTYYGISSQPHTSIFSITDLKRIGLFFALGGVYALIFEKVDKYVPWTNLWFLILITAAWVVSYFHFEEFPEVHLCTLFGIMMTISVAKIIEKNGWRFLDHLKGANFMIFLLSWYCNVLFQQVLAYFVVLPWWVYTVLSLVAGIYVPWLGYKYLEKHQESRWVRVTSWLLGQSFRPADRNPESQSAK